MAGITIPWHRSLIQAARADSPRPGNNPHAWHLQGWLLRGSCTEQSICTVQPVTFWSWGEPIATVNGFVTVECYPIRLVVSTSLAAANAPERASRMFSFLFHTQRPTQSKVLESKGCGFLLGDFKGSLSLAACQIIRCKHEHPYFSFYSFRLCGLDQESSSASNCLVTLGQSLNPSVLLFRHR